MIVYIITKLSSGALITTGWESCIAYLSLVIFVYFMLNNQHVPRLLQLRDGVGMFSLQSFNNFLKIYSLYTSAICFGQILSIVNVNTFVELN